MHALSRKYQQPNEHFKMHYASFWLLLRAARLRTGHAEPSLSFGSNRQQASDGEIVGQATLNFVTLLLSGPPRPLARSIPKISSPRTALRPAGARRAGSLTLD